MIQTMTNTKQQTKSLDSSMSVIVMLYNNPGFSNLTPSYTFDIYGKKMSEWVVDAAHGYNVERVLVHSDKDFLDDIKPHLTDSKYTALLFADTPLVTSQAISDLLDYIVYKNLNIIRLSRGYIARTDFLKMSDKIYDMQMVPLHSEEFFVAKDFESLGYIRHLIDDKIKKYHMSQGVNFLQPNSAYIEGECEISSGVTIGPNVKLCGKTSVLGPTIIDNSTIIDSNIGSKCDIQSSFIKDSTIGNDATVGPYCVVRNSEVKNFETLEPLTERVTIDKE